MHIAIAAKDVTQGRLAAAITAELMKSDVALTIYATGPAIGEFDKVGLSCLTKIGKLPDDVTHVVAGLSTDPSFERLLLDMGKILGYKVVLISDVPGMHRRVAAGQSPLGLVDLHLVADSACAAEINADFETTSVRVVGNSNVFAEQPLVIVEDALLPAKRHLGFKRVLTYGARDTIEDVVLLLECAALSEEAVAILFGFHPDPSKQPNQIRLIDYLERYLTTNQHVMCGFGTINLEKFPGARPLKDYADKLAKDRRGFIMPPRTGTPQWALTSDVFATSYTGVAWTAAYNGVPTACLRTPQVELAMQIDFPGVAEIPMVSAGVAVGVTSPVDLFGLKYPSTEAVIDKIAPFDAAKAAELILAL